MIIVKKELDRYIKNDSIPDSFTLSIYKDEEYIIQKLKNSNYNVTERKHCNKWSSVWVSMKNGYTTKNRDVYLYTVKKYELT